MAWCLGISVNGLYGLEDGDDICDVISWSTVGFCQPTLVIDHRGENVAQLRFLISHVLLAELIALSSLEILIQFRRAGEPDTLSSNRPTDCWL